MLSRPPWFVVTTFTILTSSLPAHVHDSEVAECGVFLLPFFLENSNLKAIPISAVIGIAVGIALGLGIYVANHHMKQKFWLCFTMAGLTLFLAVGLFTGGMHEFEEVWGETKTVWEISNDFFSHKDFPFVLLKPFGWSSKRTVLQICSFWCSLAVGLMYHYLKWSATKKVRQMYPDEDVSSNDGESDKVKVEEDGDAAEGGGSEEDV
jgi:high-affinity iron transporter